MTAREYCASRRSKCFGSYRLAAAGEPEWRKLTAGYIGVADGEDSNYIAPGLIFAVEMHDNIPAICTYTRNDVAGVKALRPYAISSMRHLLQRDEIWTSKRITYDKMIERVRMYYPNIRIPSQFAFWAEYGYKYDKKTDKVENYVGIDNDKE